jgi:hypothetical protein
MKKKNLLLTAAIAGAVAGFPLTANAEGEAPATEKQGCNGKGAKDKASCQAKKAPEKKDAKEKSACAGKDGCGGKDKKG